MDFEDLQQRWRAEVNQPLEPQQRQQLQNDVRQRCESLEKSVRHRDFLEITAVPVLLIWIAVAWPKVSTTWLSAIGAVLLCVWAISVVVILWRTRHRQSVPTDAPFDEFIRQKLQWCDGQIRLLKDVAWWYVLPALVAGLLIVWSKADSQKMLRVSTISVGMITFGAFFVRLNHRAVDKHFQPLRDALTRLLDDL